MKYTKPIYELTVVSTRDIIASSSKFQLGDSVVLKEISKEIASVYASAKDIFGIED